MKKQTKIACILWASMVIVCGCKKSDALKSDSEVLSKGNSKLSGGDEKWDLLGFGLDVTKDLLAPSSVSDVSIFDMRKFEQDFLDRIDAKINVTRTSEGSDEYYGGASAWDYIRDINNKRSFDSKGNVTIAGSKNTDGTTKGNDINFTGSFTKNSSDQSITAYSSKYSYATYEAWQKVKRLRFTGDVSLELLKQYLSPEFVSNVANYTAEDLVKRYGTHVMLDISIGGRLRFNYSGIVINESDTEKKTSYVQTGFGLNIVKLLGVNITKDKTVEEMTKVAGETRSKEYTGKFYGGTNSGKSISFDKDGNTTENLNLASWQQSINEKNAALVDVGRAVFLYDFISDPVKKGLVKAAVEKHIHDSQLKELGEVAVYEFYSGIQSDHWLSTDRNVTVPYPSAQWQYLNVNFYAHAQQYPGTVPVYEFYSSNQTDHWISTDRNVTVPYPLAGWQYYGIKFYVFPSQVAGTVPVYEFYNPAVTDHVFTTNVNATNGYPGWTNYGIKFYVYPSN
ncbi:hypothetical protein DBR11_20225 [Pedobacter sp. HMWF019]|uniref:MAC/perforin domain-containing protein n=1 Tax=Pedobacter sp. HMWF019 TaxID=2056856 RepID=UPI000D3B01C7|nr:MAC/perforin domain-containing protein [Pedobacter sp. HMWF019]PTS95922.1 hypothetical protein DBR11_20225 [Pedobacter sp. HMWF019]